MLPGLRASKLQIDWLEAGRARAVMAGLVDIEIERDDDGVPLIELDIFPDDHSWLGLQVADNITPIWRGAEAEHPFRQITAPDGANWWVPALSWNASRRRHNNAFLRGLGQFDVVIGDQVLRIVTRHHETVRLGDYLRDFRDELIWLILGQEGGGEVPRGGDSDLAATFGAFVDAALSVAADLPRELQETTAPMPRSRVRPNAATFRALDRAPLALILPGRVSEAQADIPDNRFLRHMIQGAQVLAQAVSQAGQKQAHALRRRAAQLAEVGRELTEQEWQDVEPEVFDAQLDDLSQRMERITNWRPKEPTTGPHVARSFLITELVRGFRTRFFFKPVEAAADTQVIELPDEVAQLVRDSAQVEKTFTFHVPVEHFRRSQSQFGNGKPFSLHKITQVASIQPSGAKLDARRRRREMLEANGWRVRLNDEARKEHRQAGRVSQARAAYLDSLARGATRLAESLAAGCSRLRRLDRDLAVQGVGLSVTPPQGLRWRLHPPHVTCLSAFRHLQDAAQAQGLDLGVLERLDRISTLHASALYERWCLVKILAVLIGDYHFRPPEGWQTALVDSVTRPDGRITLDLARSDLLLGARLDVQPVLRNGRRPDFRLRVIYLPKTPSTRARNELFSEARGLVMDAKFRSHWTLGETQAMVEGLVRQKGYGQEGDAVFVLQPCGKTIARRTSPLKWGAHCDYGQDHPGNHGQGHIWLAPNADLADPQAHLRRLVAQLMQACFARPSPIRPDDLQEFREGLFESADRSAGRIEDDDQGHRRRAGDLRTPFFSASFCISCGKAHTYGDVERRLTGKEGSKRRREYWVISCSDCGLKVTRTHCYSCADTVLFKNHLRLTYHRTIAEQPTHVVCPKCGAYFDEEQNAEVGRFPHG